MIQATNETAIELLQMIQIQQSSKTLALLEEADSRYIKDLKVNVGNVLQSEHLSAKETALLAVAVASNAKNQLLLDGFIALAKKNEAANEEIAESIACASLLASNNVFYRFRHFMGSEIYDRMPGRIKMSIMMKPILGKEFFELVSLAVSAINGCELCVTSHEKSVKELGTSENRIWDSIRLASVINSLDRILYT